MIAFQFTRPELFPAHAGVIPQRDIARQILPSIPRPRGGDPERAEAVEGSGIYSPPTRG